MICDLSSRQITCGMYKSHENTKKERIEMIEKKLLVAALRVIAYQDFKVAIVLPNKYYKFRPNPVLQLCVIS